MRKKKMTISNQSEHEGGEADLKPSDDARWFNHQTNWKYFGRQILCQVGKNTEQEFMTLTFGRQCQSLDIGIGGGLTRRRRERSLLLIV